MVKLCECGCGQPAPIAKKTITRLGHIKGQPIRFIYLHQNSPKNIEKHARWKGGRQRHSQGYVLIHGPGHPRANSAGCVLEHLLVAEKALGRPIPIRVPVHHVNEDRLDNAGRNLVICNDLAYHKLLHQRMEAYKATGDAHSRRCSFCQQWGLDLFEASDHAYHRECRRRYRRNHELKQEVSNGV